MDSLGVEVSSRMKAPAIGLTIALALCAHVVAQGQQSPATSSTAATAWPHPDTDYATPIRMEPDRIPATGFVMPDVPDGWNEQTTYDGHLFSTGLSVVALIELRS